MKTTSVKQEQKLIVCSNFQITFLPLVSCIPPQMRLQVKLTFGQTLGQADLWSDVPPRQRTLVAKCITTLGQVDICQIFKSGWPLVRCTPNSDFLWPSVTTLVRLTFCQSLGQVDLWSDVPPAETSCGQVCYYFGQVDVLSDLKVRLTFVRYTSPAETSCS